MEFETGDARKNRRILGLRPGVFAALVISGVLLVAVVAPVLFCGGCCGMLSLLPTLTPSLTPRPTIPPTSTWTPVPTDTSTPTRTPVPTSTPTPGPSPTPTDTPIPTDTPTLTKTPTPTQTPTPSLTPTSVLAGATVWLVHEDQQVGVREIAWDYRLGYYRPEEGKIFISLYIVGINIGDGEETFNPLDFELVDGGGQVHGYLIFAEKEPSFSLCTVRPGGVCEGWWTTSIWDREDVKTNLAFNWAPSLFDPGIETPILQ